MSQSLIQKYAKPVPRYTSYPTAPHFHGSIDSATYRDWLGMIETGHSLSLYVHIPYCDTLCWFCGCNTKHTVRYQPVADYLPILKQEIATVSASIAASPQCKTLHWGGGSPTILTPEDTIDIASFIARYFQPASDAEFSIEIDPRGMTQDKIEVLAHVGVTRASIGVQDFDGRVQQAINRTQSFDETQKVIETLRQEGISRINLDLIYGLPFQTVQSVKQTVRKVVQLKPDRIALFGYAHVPWMKRHQSMIDTQSLPDPAERLEQSQVMAEMLCDTGYERIGMDHFALPADPLAKAMRSGRLRRNFQGYTDDPADVLLGFGASAIGKLPQGYVQNETSSAAYKRHVIATGLAVASGYAFKPDDQLRAYVIERLICDFGFSCRALRERFGDRVQEIFDIASRYARNDSDDLVTWSSEGLKITPAGRPFVRTICAQFDAFLETGSARHSLSV